MSNILPFVDGGYTKQRSISVLSTIAESASVRANITFRLRLLLNRPKTAGSCERSRPWPLLMREQKQYFWDGALFIFPFGDNKMLFANLYI